MVIRNFLSCLAASQRRRLDGFYARCLRKILRIRTAYISRVSNACVFQRAGVQPFSAQLQRRQILLLGRVAHAPISSALRSSVFVGDGLSTQINRFKRRRGRPRLDWVNEVMKEGERLLGKQTLESMLDRSRNAAATLERHL